MGARKKPTINLEIAGAGTRQEEAFIRAGEASEQSDAKAVKRRAAEATHRTMVYLPISLWRPLRVHLAHTDEPITSFLARAARDLLEREASSVSSRAK